MMPWPALQRLSRTGLAELNPAYFALVMATGIISIAAHMFGLAGVARGLLHFNLVAYLLLWLLYGLRLALFARRCLDDLRDHGRAPGYFSCVAGTAVLGSQYVVLAQAYRVAAVLWGLAGLLWLGLTYGLFAGLMTRQIKPSLARAVHGGWLLAVVAIQAVVVLGVQLAPWASPAVREALYFAALSLWLAGGVLYIWLMAFVLHRHLFRRVDAAELAPSLWISMGAMAISTLAGSLLLEHGAAAPLLALLRPFIMGITVCFWATGTWWIPLLLLLGVWRHLLCRVPLTYHPLYWSAVFPLGMYAVATAHLARVLQLEFLHAPAHVFLYVALLAWAVVLAGLLRTLWRQGRASPQSGQPVRADTAAGGNK